jgi:hypothetical protein
VAGFGAEGNRQPIPGIDRGDGHDEIYKLGVAELSVRLGLDLIRNLIDADQCDGLGERERSSLAFGEKGSFAPRRDGVEALLGFAQRARVLGVHVETVGAAVDLRSAKFYQFEHKRLKTGLVNIHFCETDARAHGCSLFNLWFLVR